MPYVYGDSFGDVNRMGLATRGQDLSEAQFRANNIFQQARQTQDAYNQARAMAEQEQQNVERNALAQAQLGLQGQAQAMQGQEMAFRQGPQFGFQLSEAAGAGAERERAMALAEQQATETGQYHKSYLDLLGKSSADATAKADAFSFADAARLASLGIYVDSSQFPGSQANALDSIMEDHSKRIKPLFEAGELGAKLRNSLDDAAKKLRLLYPTKFSSLVPSLAPGTGLAIITDDDRKVLGNKLKSVEEQARKYNENLQAFQRQDLNKNLRDKIQYDDQLRRWVNLVPSPPDWGAPSGTQPSPEVRTQPKAGNVYNYKATGNDLRQSP